MIQQESRLKGNRQLAAQRKSFVFVFLVVPSAVMRTLVTLSLLPLKKLTQPVT